jgi:hypothetical protein
MKGPRERSLTGLELIDRFEKGLPPEEPFHHADHVRLAFEYLRVNPALEALAKFSSALKRFANARGKPQLYHATITFAYLFLIHERMNTGEDSEWEDWNWEDFARQNVDLLTWKDGVLNRYYREARLKSDLARRVFILPDKCLDLQTPP